MKKITLSLGYIDFSNNYIFIPIIINHEQISNLEFKFIFNKNDLRYISFNNNVLDNVLVNNDDGIISINYYTIIQSGKLITLRFEIIQNIKTKLYLQSLEGIFETSCIILSPPKNLEMSSLTQQTLHLFKGENAISFIINNLLDYPFKDIDEIKNVYTLHYTDSEWKKTNCKDIQLINADVYWIKCNKNITLKYFGSKTNDYQLILNAKETRWIPCHMKINCIENYNIVSAQTYFNNHFHIYVKDEDNCCLDFEDLNVGKGYLIKMGIFDISLNIIIQTPSTNNALKDYIFADYYSEPEPEGCC